MAFFETTMSFLKDKEYRDLLIASALVISLGTVTYRLLEGWSWIDCVYFSVITLTTVGYGDITPQTDAGKLFTIFYIIVGLGMILSFIDTVYRHYSQTTRNKSSK